MTNMGAKFSNPQPNLEFSLGFVQAFKNWASGDFFYTPPPPPPGGNHKGALVQCFDGDSTRKKIENDQIISKSKKPKNGGANSAVAGLGFKVAPGISHSAPPQLLPVGAFLWHIWYVADPGIAEPLGLVLPTALHIAHLHINDPNYPNAQLVCLCLCLCLCLRI